MSTRSSLILVRLCEEVRKLKLVNSVGYKPWFVMFRIFSFGFPAKKLGKE